MIKFFQEGIIMFAKQGAIYWFRVMLYIALDPSEGYISIVLKSYQHDSYLVLMFHVITNI